MGIVGAVTLAAFDGYKNVASAATIGVDKLTRDHFAPFVGHAFLAHQRSGLPVSLKLRQTEDINMGSRMPANLRQPFSLLFDGPASVLHSDGVYRVDHPTLGHIEFFMARVGDQKERATFEAIFA
jgi:hypothetical protein